MAASPSPGGHLRRELTQERSQVLSRPARRSIPPGAENLRGAHPDPRLPSSCPGGAAQPAAQEATRAHASSLPSPTPWTVGRHGPTRCAGRTGLRRAWGPPLLDPFRRRAAHNPLLLPGAFQAVLGVTAATGRAASWSASPCGRSPWPWHRNRSRRQRGSPVCARKRTWAPRLGGRRAQVRDRCRSSRTTQTQ